MKYLYRLTLLLLLSFSVFAADGPNYIKGTGATHATTCTPPTTRAPDPDGVQVPLALSELQNASVYLYQGGGLFSLGTLVAGPIDTDIYCTHTWQVDDYPTGQYYVRATETDTGGRTSVVSVDSGPFFSSWPLMPPGPPTMGAPAAP